MRKLKGYNTGVSINTVTKFNVFTDISFAASDLMLSVLTDKRLNSTEKAIIGIILEDVLKHRESIDIGNGNNVEVDYITSDVTINKKYIANISSDINTKYLSTYLDTTKRTIFTNLYSLIEKGIIEFKRESFSEYGKIKLNLGFLASEFYNKEGEQ